MPLVLGAQMRPNPNPNPNPDPDPDPDPDANPNPNPNPNPLTLTWKTAMGEVICSRYSSPKEGSGMLNELPPKSSLRTAACRRLSPSLAA